MKKPLLLSASVLALAAALTVVPAGAQEITIVLGNEPTTLDPQLTEDGSERAVSDNVYETLMTRTPAGELQPGLAVAFPEQVDDNTWRFTLHEGISFTNGEPLNAEAVAFSVNRIIDPEYNSSQISFFSTLTGAVAIDEYTVEITTSGPDPILPARFYWLKIVPPIAASEPDFAQNPVGTGPYMFAERQTGSSITLVRNPDYWGDEPEIDEVTYRYVADSGAQMAGLLAGEFDLMTRLPPEFVDMVPVALSVEGLEQPVLVLSAVSGITADLRVRQALNYAIDQEALAEALFGPYASVSQGQLLAPTYFGYNPELQSYGYDPELAMQLLEEAGVAGQTIQLVASNDRWLKDGEIAAAVAGMWEAVGLTVDARITPFSDYVQHVYNREHRVDALFVSNSNELMDADRPLSAYYSMSGPGSSNEDTELRDLIDAARIETDPAVREDLYHQAVALANEQAYFGWLILMNDLYGASERLVWEPRVDAKLLISEMSVTE